MLIPDIIDIDHSPGDAPAFIEAGRRVGYYDAATQIDSLAAHFISSGLEPGSRIAVLMPNSWKYVRTVFASIKAGLIPAVLHPKTAPGEVDHLMEIAQPSALAADAQMLRRLTDAFAAWARRMEYIGVYGDEGKSKRVSYNLGCSVENLDIKGPTSTDISGRRGNPTPDDGAVILFTTGTTGRPKGVLLSHSNILSVAEAVVDAFDLCNTDRTLVISPLAHVSAFTSQMIAYTLAGAACCIVRDLAFPRDVLDFAAENRVSSIHGMPAAVAILLRSINQGERPLPDLRFISISGERVRRRFLDEVIEKFPGVTIYNSYGLSEAAPRITSMRLDNAPGKVASVGQPWPICDVRIVDDTGCELPTGQTGELLVRSPGCMKCYFNDDEATANVFTDGWLHTGDLAKLDDDGYIYLEGRVNEVINVGGEKVNPFEVEDAIDEIPGIKDVLVFGKEHEILGEVPVALVVLEEGESFDGEEILKQLKPRLSSFKMPVEIHFVVSLPRGDRGKIIRRVPGYLTGDFPG